MRIASNASTSGLKKGAWTTKEDMLLKKCIEKFGEGKWHLVPLRAGLNRCRKSCRLRWLNYLRPDIKRGDFDKDEIDLILRLHKLLGNRWSLIAGRIPGRTANDVKNYWNTHLRAQSKQQKKVQKVDESSQHTTVTVLKPKPRTLSKIVNHNPHIATNDNGYLKISSKNMIQNTTNISPGKISYPKVTDDKVNEVLDFLFHDQVKEIDGEIEWPFGWLSEERQQTLHVVEQGDEKNSLLEFSKDEIMWDLLDSR